MKKRILVTGGTGYIGSHTVVELQNDGFEVIIIDNLSNSKSDAVDGIEKITGIRPVFEKVELCNYEEVKKVTDKYSDICGVIHFAAFKAVGESVSNPLLYYHNNINSLTNLLKAFDNFKNKIAFVFSSSCAVYGNPEILPVSEEMNFGEPTSPYGRTKQIAEYILKDHTVENKNLKVIALRYFNPIGAHESGKIGESPLKTYNLVPILTETATGKRKEILINGNDYNTPDGTCVRDYIHVVDVAKAHIAAMKRIVKCEQDADYEFFNLGIGKGYSIMEVIRTFEKVSSRKISYRVAERRIGDVASVYASTDKANRILGWKAEYDLSQMLYSAWKWENDYRTY